VANYRRLPDGKPAREAFATEAEAHVFLDRWYADRSTARLQAKQRAASELAVARTLTAKRTFARLIRAWRAEREGEVRASTWRNYGPGLRALEHYLGDRPADELTARHFLAYRKARLAGKDWVERTDVPPIGPATVNQHLDRAEQIFDWAIRRGLVSGPNPVAGIGKLKVERFEPVVVEADEIEALIAAAPAEHRLAFMLIGHLALRWGEAYGAGLRSVSDGHVVVRQQLVEDRENRHRIVVARYVKRDRSRRRLLATRAILEEADAQRERLDGQPNPDQLLTTARNGSPIRYANWQRSVWVKTLERARLPKGLTPHGVRHSRLSLLAASGRVTVGRLSRFAGHASVAFTLSKYGDWFSDEDVDVFDEFGDAAPDDGEVVDAAPTAS
jgi:integrase